MRIKQFCLIFLFSSVFLFLKTPSEVFGQDCGCQDTIIAGCKEDLLTNPCPELKRCKCESLVKVQVVGFGCIGHCIDDPNDPHCNPGTGRKADGVRTAIGCIPLYNLQNFIGWVLPKVIYIASGIAFLLMVFGTFQIITSSGDPKKKQAGSELITSALSGLLFIILSIFLLKLIGVDILRIPGLG